MYLLFVFVQIHLLTPVAEASQNKHKNIKEFQTRLRNHHRIHRKSQSGSMWKCNIFTLWLVANKIISLCIFLSFARFSLLWDPNPNFYHDREILLKKEDREYLGSDLVLSPSESAANEFLMYDKHKEILEIFNNHNESSSNSFPPSQNFLVSKPFIEESAVFHFIKNLPKGENINL